MKVKITSIKKLVNSTNNSQFLLATVSGGLVVKVREDGSTSAYPATATLPINSSHESAESFLGMELEGKIEKISVPEYQIVKADGTTETKNTKHVFVPA